jgi:hypothetical protein
MMKKTLSLLLTLALVCGPAAASCDSVNVNGACVENGNENENDGHGAAAGLALGALLAVGIYYFMNKGPYASYGLHAQPEQPKPALQGQWVPQAQVSSDKSFLGLAYQLPF